jgi:hypothetical protein
MASLKQPFLHIYRLLWLLLQEFPCKKNFKEDPALKKLVIKAGSILPNAGLSIGGWPAG